MTRINVVPVSELVDKHLVAEYRELPRIYKAAQKFYDNGEKGFVRICFRNRSYEIFLL